MSTQKETLASFLFYLHDYFVSLSGENLFSFLSRMRIEVSKNADRDPFFFKRVTAVELFRKILMHFGLCHDIISLTQSQTADRISLLRYSFAGGASLSLPNTRCRFLLRVDDFPSAFASSKSFPLFHQIATEHGLPYLLAVTPYLNEEGLSDSEVKMLQKYKGEGMTPALHGFTHKRIKPGTSSELLGMPEQSLRKAVQKSRDYLKGFSLEPSVFVAPFNSYDPSTLSALSEFFSVLCGGPESTVGIGYRGPGFIGESLYLPSYRGAYDLKNNFYWIQTIKAEGNGLIIPITLHWANELKNNFQNFKKLCKIIQPQMLSWDEILSLRAKILKAI